MEGIWITIPVKEEIETGSYPIKIRISGKDDSTFGENREWYGEQLFILDILPVTLPKQEIIHTEWFSADCIGTWYHLEPLTQPWWKMMGVYIRNAAEYGINMLLTPVFTPPLETREGMERPTVQLVKITKTKDSYEFDFTNLKKWVVMAKELGIEYFEMPHLFTQ